MSTDKKKDCNETNHYKFLKLMYGVMEEFEVNREEPPEKEWGNRDKLPRDDQELTGG